MTKPKQARKTLSENTGKTFSVIMPPFSSKGGAQLRKWLYLKESNAHKKSSFFSNQSRKNVPSKHVSIQKWRFLKVQLFLSDGRHFQGSSHTWQSCPGHQPLPWICSRSPWSWHVGFSRFVVWVKVSFFSNIRLGSFVVRGTPWDPWTAPWQAFLRLAGEDKYLLYVFGIYTSKSIFICILLEFLDLQQLYMYLFICKCRL